MGKHSQSDGNFRQKYPKYPKYPILAASAVLAVAGVSAFLVTGGAPKIAVLVGGQSPAAASSSAGTTHGSAQSGGGSALSASSGGVQRFLAGGARTRTRFVVPSFFPHTAAPSSYHLVIPTFGPKGTPTVTHTVTPTVTPTITPTITPTVTPTVTPTSTQSGSGQFFGIAPVGTSLPRSDADCASQVQPMAENVSANTTANHTTPSGSLQLGPWAQRIANFTHVDGNFTGTTGEILEWAACKWGWNQDYAMAEAVIESTWRQSVASNNTYGILQVKAARSGSSPSANTGWGGYPWVQQSTAFNADMQMAYLRACYDGDTTWLGNGYQAGDAWGCIGSWYSGDWHSAAANGYISRVQSDLNSQAWLKV
jgi:autotransporter family porin